jgi:hypothetical protein
MSQTREQWLISAADLLRAEVFVDHEIPPFRVSVGWPGGSGPKSSTIGQCWNTGASEDGVPQVFVSPVVKSRIETLRVLVHEMIHVFDDCKNGHRKTFLQLFRKVGMVGKATECEAGEELLEKLTGIAERLGDYPHEPIKRGQRGAEGPAPQKNRQLLVACMQEEELEMKDRYKVRTTRLQLDAIGFPICPCHHESMEEQVKS